jgi:DNA-binding transcriptional LysR family regulator
METRYFKTILTAVECGSFSKTAEILHVTQSAVSQRIKFLEENYGHQLLDRNTAALEPTAAGKIVLEHAQKIINEERQLLQQLENMTGLKRLSLCCTPTYGMSFLPGVLNEFVRQNSDLTDLKFLFQQPEQAITGLLNKEFDVAILEHCGDFDASPFTTVELPRDELLFISAPQLAIEPEHSSLKEILKHRLYARRDGCSSKELLKQNLATLGSSIDNFSAVIVSDDLRLTIESVRQGAGTAYISTSLVAEQLTTKELRAHHVEGFTHFRRRTILVRKGRETDPIIKSILTCAMEAARTSAENQPNTCFSCK